MQEGERTQGWEGARTGGHNGKRAGGYNVKRAEGLVPLQPCTCHTLMPSHPCKCPKSHLVKLSQPDICFTITVKLPLDFDCNLSIKHRLLVQEN